MDSHLPSSGPWDSGVTQSQKSPFSEKLMLFITALLGASGTGNYGLALAASPRHDIAFLYSRIIVEVGTFAEDIADLLIEKGWLEQPPLSEDRRD